MIDVHRADDRFRSGSAGVETWHSFSAGAHYDPANVSFGPVVACDEHLLAPGAGFALHSHAQVELVSWVLAGALQHEDASGHAVVVRPGEVQFQHAGRGIEHVERNASRTEPLRFLQLWFLADADEPAYEVTVPPVRLERATFSVLRSGVVRAAQIHLFVTGERCTVNGVELHAADTLRASDESLTVDAEHDVLVVVVPPVVT